MNDMTEDQQAEQLKQWWRENGKSVVTGLVLGIGIIVGWQGWKAHKQQVAEEGSQAYTQYQLVAPGEETVFTQGERLIAEHADTPYAALTALDLASKHVDKGELEKAESQLRWVMANAKQKGVPEIARLRLAQVLSAAGKHDDALAQLKDVPKGMEGLYEEARGDTLKAKGDRAGAAASYDKAMELLPKSSPLRLLLEMKRDDLGVS